MLAPPLGSWRPLLGEILDPPLNRYLFSVVNGNRYLPRGSKENVLSITITENVTMPRYVVLVVFLDFVVIH